MSPNIQLPATYKSTVTNGIYKEAIKISAMHKFMRNVLVGVCTFCTRDMTVITIPLAGMASKNISMFAATMTVLSVIEYSMRLTVWHSPSLHRVVDELLKAISQPYNLLFSEWIQSSLANLIFYRISQSLSPFFAFFSCSKQYLLFNSSFLKRGEQQWFLNDKICKNKKKIQLELLTMRKGKNRNCTI